jgi:Spy/CpxP family protein refolding chaperone
MKGAIGMKKILSLLVLCVLLMQTSAWAADWGKMRKSCPDKNSFMMHNAKLREALKLTDQQIKELQKRIFAFQKEAVKERASLQLAQIELREIRAQEPMDMKKAEAKIRQIASLQADMKIARMKQIEEGKSILTPEQKNTLNKMKMHPMMRPRHSGEVAPDEEVTESLPDELDEATYLEEVFEISLLTDGE